MGKRTIIAGLAAVMLSIGGAVYAQNDSDLDKVLVLSVGTGGYGRYQFTHDTLFTDGGSPLDNVDTYQALILGAPVFLRLDLLKYIGVEASAFYLRNIYLSGYESGGSDNDIKAAFSLYAQFPRQVSNSLTVVPFFGVGYDMLFFFWNDTGSYMRSKFENLNDNLLIKMGIGLNGSLTDNFRLNLRLVYDVLLYNKGIADVTDLYKDRGATFFAIQHAPSLFLGVSYAFLKI